MSDYEVRLQEFGESFEGFEWTDIRRLVVEAGCWLERLIQDHAAVDTMMKQLYVALDRVQSLDPAHELATPWQELWREAELVDIAIGQRLTSLHAFAFFGLSPVDGLASEPTEEQVTARVSEMRALINTAPKEWGAPELIEKTVLAAEARCRLDAGHNVTVDQLAALAQVAPKSLRNLLAPSSGSGMALNSDGEIETEVARTWLLGRQDFKSSLWREAKHIETPLDRNLSDEIFFVPAADDGSIFHPETCARGGRYTIGQKGSEIQITNYRDALSKLARQSTPRWRRPNKSGNWGIVVGKNWRRCTASELGL